MLMMVKGVTNQRSQTQGINRALSISLISGNQKSEEERCGFMNGRKKEAKERMKGTKAGASKGKAQTKESDQGV